MAAKFYAAAHAARGVTLADLRRDVVGIDTEIPLLDGTRRPYVFLDNAASTPTFGSVLRRIAEFMPWYSGVHRGVGFKAVVATNVYDQTRRIAGEFVGADLSRNVVLFMRNTTECVNRLAHHLDLRPDDVVVSTLMEHHSNDLPWRKYCRVVRAGIRPDGGIDLRQLRDELGRWKASVRLVAVSGASNVIGICNPIHEIAEWAHEAGARIFVDAAQLVAHRRVDMRPGDDPGHIDFLAYSAHKIYAPFGVGVLIGPSDFFSGREPELVGGGTVSYVGAEDVEWASLPQREEAGSPNVVGAVALAEALSILGGIGMDVIADHERALLEYALRRLGSIGGLRIYGPVDDLREKVGVIPFNVDGMDHALVATILSTEGGIGVRNGNFCAQPYMRALLGVSAGEEQAARAARCDQPVLPGMVRASLGCYNTEEDIDFLADMLERIVKNEYSGSYFVDPVTGMYRTETYQVNPAEHFRFFDSRNAPPRGEEIA